MSTPDTLTLIAYASCDGMGRTVDKFTCEPGDKLAPNLAAYIAQQDADRYPAYQGYHVRPVYVGAPLPKENTP